MRWPAHGTATRASAKHSVQVRKAFQSVLHGDEIAQRWAETHPAGGSVSPQMARDWARVHITASTKPMQDALASIYADGWIIGERAANYMVAHLTGLSKAPKTDNAPTLAGFQVNSGIVDWATWKPGNPQAAALVKPRGGLESLLASRKITIADDVIATKLDRIGTALATGLSKGFTTQQTAQMIDTVINDPEHALVIAQTEMSRAVSVATRNSYEDAGVQQVEWLVAEGCDDCQENADASPIGIDETFPSGDTEPPAHPNCMCALAAYYDPASNDLGSSDLELSVMPDLAKFVPSKLEVEQAKSRLKILPNPPPDDVPENANPEKLVESPWATIEPITVDPNVWSDAELAIVNLKDLTATDKYMRRKKVKEHIEVMGQAVTPYRSFALIVQRENQQIIIDGHHRLTAMWLLGQQQAPVWLAKETKEK